MKKRRKERKGGGGGGGDQHSPGFKQLRFSLGDLRLYH